MPNYYRWDRYEEKANYSLTSVGSGSIRIYNGYAYDVGESSIEYSEYYSGSSIEATSDGEIRVTGTTSGFGDIQYGHPNGGSFLGTYQLVYAFIDESGGRIDYAIKNGSITNWTYYTNYYDYEMYYTTLSWTDRYVATYSGTTSTKTGYAFSPDPSAFEVGDGYQNRVLL